MIAGRRFSYDREALFLETTAVIHKLLKDRNSKTFEVRTVCFVDLTELNLLALTFNKV
jgi:hypothetical protein